MDKYPEIIVGTYEEFLLGYNIAETNDEKLKLHLNLASHAHQGSIRCVTSHNNFMASSGADEYINVFSLLNRKEIAVLTPHSGTVTCLTFTPDGSHLISGGQDGNITIVRCKDWKSMKTWKEAHKRSNGVTGLDVHPSGKLLLSIGDDHILRVWNLIKGRQAYATNFGKKLSGGIGLNLVAWSKDGSAYAVCFGSTVEFYNVDKAAVIYSVTSSSKIVCIDFSEKGVVALGCDDGRLEFHKFTKNKKVLDMKGHEKRVKCVKFYHHPDGNDLIVTADSQGVIKVWDIEKWSSGLNLRGEVNADCRIVCLTLTSNNLKLKEEESESNGNELVQSKHENNRSKTKKEQLKSISTNEESIEIIQDNLKVVNNAKMSDQGNKRKSNDKDSIMKEKKKKRFSTSKWDVSTEKNE